MQQNTNMSNKQHFKTRKQRNILRDKYITYLM